MERYNNNGPRAPKGARLAFGILMIFVYVGAGLLFFYNIYNIDNTALRYTIGSLLCAYGVWRAVRLYKGWG